MVYLKAQSIEEVRQRFANLPEAHKAQVSPQWLKALADAVEADPWVHGFSVRLKDNNATVGECGFKGPPKEGSVEIAYYIYPEYEGKGYATEATKGLLNYATGNGAVTKVLAHTLPERNASTRVLTKNGFKFMGEVIDPEDGPVWRWEKFLG